MNYKYMQSIVNYRIPVKEDGTLGNPEIESKWTKERGQPKKKKPIPKAEQKQLYGEEVKEEYVE